MRALGPARRRLARGVLSLMIIVGAVAVSAGQAAASPGAYKVLFADANDGGCVSNTLQSQFASQPGVSSVASFDASTGTPSVALLDQYDMVVTISDCAGYFDGMAMGDNLAAYASQGGVVVEFPYGMEISTTDELTGNWLNLSPFEPGSNPNDPVTLGSHDTSSPLMAGVTSLTSDGCLTTGTLAPGARSVALWNTGQEAVAYKGQAIGVTAGMDGSCTFSGDYARLVLNAVKWRGPHFLKVKRAGRGTGKVLSNPRGIACGKTCAAIYKFGEAVTLRAKASKHSKFAGWSGACKGHGKTCSVTMNGARKVTATFKRRSA